MRSAKEIVVKVVPSNVANRFVRLHHYSGKVVQNSSLHFGCFLDGELHGVMSFGTPMDKRRVLGLVATENKTENSKWNEMLELNRMAFNDNLPRNSESRCISIAIRLLRKNAPQVKWILSFADGTQCGDGTIYRASGFKLTSIKPNKQIMRLPDGTLIARKTLDNKNHSGKVNGRYGSSVALENGAKYIDGWQLRYIYLIDKKAKLTVPEIPFSKIDDMGAGMYKGEKISIIERKQQAQEV